MDAVFKALEAPRRRELLRLVWDAERGAGELSRAQPEVTFGAVSQHLRILERAGLVRARQDGRRRFYRAEKEALGPLRAWLESMWDDALAGLKLAAEAEASRPAPKSRRRPRASKRTPPKTPALRSSRRSTRRRPDSKRRR